MPKPVITVENLSKAYRIGLKEEIPDTLVSAMSGMMKAPFRKFRDLRKLDTFGHSGADEEDIYWALKDVSFEVQEGEVLGVIGRNGAGKSTLLKILSRITEPTSGRAVIRGRVSSLLEVGTGFHPELSGRENVYLNGTILGMTKREIDRKFDEIVDFSGIDKFLDTPIKRYSSGMKVRLAFAVAAHLEPEILIIDEVLAVGDMEFQKKCLGKMQDVASGGRTVLFVSHSMGAVSDLCHRVILLTRGSISGDGSPAEIIPEYIGHHDSVTRFEDGNVIPDRSGDGPIRLISAKLLNQVGYEQATFRYGDELQIQLNMSTPIVTVPVIGISIWDARGHLVLHPNTVDDDFEVKLRQSTTLVRSRIRNLPLNDGEYSVTIWLGDGTNILNDRVPNCLRFKVDSSVDGSIRCQAPIRVNATWDFP